MTIDTKGLSGQSILSLEKELNAQHTKELNTLWYWKGRCFEGEIELEPLAMKQMEEETAALRHQMNRMRDHISEHHPKAILR